MAILPILELGLCLVMLHFLMYFITVPQTVTVSVEHNAYRLNNGHWILGKYFGTNLLKHIFEVDIIL